MRAQANPLRTDSSARHISAGTLPAGAQDEREAQQRVREMFSRIAPRYDFLNHFLSASFDKSWRQKAADRFSAVLSRADARVLDLCCGTGDLAFAFAEQARRGSGSGRSESCQIVAADFALPMLALAFVKNRRAKVRCLFSAADALALPFADASLDLVATAFGFRNLANYDRGLREIHRVLRPGGQLGILEFCEPQSGILAALFRVYFTRILPRIGGVISGSGDAYSYLPASVEKFPPPEVLKTWMERAGFRDVQYERWTFGAVALHRAWR